MDTITNLPPSTLIGGVLALFTLLGFLKSFVSLFFNLIALAFAALAGLWTYNNGYTIAEKAIAEPQPWMSMALGLTAFVVTLIFIRKILAFLAGRSSEGSQGRTGGFGIPGGAFGLIIGGTIAYFMLTGVRYAGTMSELERLGDYVGGQVDSQSEQPFFSKLKQWIDSSKLGEWHQKIDFLNDPAEANAAKLAVVKEKSQEKFAQIATQQGQDIIYDAIPVDPAIQEAYDRGNFARLLKNSAVQQKLRETFTDEQLRKLDIEGILGLKK